MYSNGKLYSFIPPNGKKGNVLSCNGDGVYEWVNIANNFEELISLAKEGLENRKSVIANALESGVHSMGNAFSKEIFEKTFSNMSTKDIEEMGKAWEEQASAKFEKEKVSKQDFSNEKEVKMRVELKQFKTTNY